MKLGFRKGAEGFTLIEIIIILAVLAILAAVVVPNVTGFVSRGKERSWNGDRDILQAAVDTYRTDIKNRTGNPWPVSDNKTIGIPTDNGTNGSFADAGDLKKGIIDVSKLATDKYIKGADSLKSASVDRGQLGAINSPSGSYIWYVSTNGTVESLYWDGSAWQYSFQTDIYP